MTQHPSHRVATTQPDYPPILTELAEFIAQALQQQGIALDAARSSAEQATEQVRQHFGGALTYIPKGSRFPGAERNAEIP